MGMGKMTRSCYLCFLHLLKSFRGDYVIGASGLVSVRHFSAQLVLLFPRTIRLNGQHLPVPHQMLRQQRKEILWNLPLPKGDYQHISPDIRYRTLAMQHSAFPT